MMQSDLTNKFAIIGFFSNSEDFQLEIRGNMPLPRLAPRTRYKLSFIPITPVAKKLTESKTIAKLEYDK